MATSIHRRLTEGATVPARQLRYAIATENAMEHAAEIKGLFLAHDRPEFPDFFDRTYPAAVNRGATTWLGRDENGHLIMFGACFPRRFKFGHREVLAGLMANLMVARAYRSFFPALALVKRAVQDLAARGDVDFVYTDPNEPARLLLQAGRFAPVGTLRRHVLPVADDRGLVDLGIRLLHVFVRAADRTASGVLAVPHPAKGFTVESVEAPHPRSRRLTAYHDLALYVSRMPGYPSDLDWWFTVRRPGTATSSSQDAALLIRGPDASGWASLRAVRWAPDLGLASVLPSLVAELRRRGCRRLQVGTVAESEFGRGLRRAGFLPRADAVPILAAALSPAGRECVRSVTQWEITDLDCDR
jgi:hypothetical protein